MWCRVPKSPSNNRQRKIHYGFNGRVRCSTLPNARTYTEVLEPVSEGELNIRSICRECIFIMLAKNISGLDWDGGMLPPPQYKSVSRLCNDYDFLEHFLPTLHKKFSAPH